MAKILIVDDEESIRSSLAMILQYAGHNTVDAADGEKALNYLAQGGHPDVIVCDVKMPQMDGLECLEKITESHPGLPVIMISGHGTIETALEATRRGAFDFIEKPLDQDRVLLTIRNAVDQVSLQVETRELKGALSDRWRLLGQSKSIEEVRKTIERIGPTDARVLVTGENGSGKELVARNLHSFSKRSGKPFVDLNCAAIPSELIESELFGHEKGSFTGADRQKIGRFEQAHGGTLFLDEIGDMDPNAQAKVLRVLETAELQRIGGTETIAVDVRVIAATNKDLELEVSEGRFREDLLYRLNVIPIHLAPLRDRREDILELFEKFESEVCEKYELERRPLSDEARDYLMRLSWPGNVRELRNFSERVILLSSDDAIEVEDIKRLQGPAAKEREDNVFDIETFEEFKAHSEKLFLRRKLEENSWNIKRTAESLGMQRSNLYKKIDRYNLK